MSIVSNVYINGVYQGQTPDTFWPLNTIIISEDDSRNGVAWGGIYSWRIDTHDTASGLTTTGDTWGFTVQPVPVPFAPSPIVPPRPSPYDPNAIWDPASGKWTTGQAAGGGAYKDVIILIGGGGEIFYGDV
ncbi:MAG: hypothetical protein ABSF37_06175 [Sedimentisphaerales bacterium]|jgi:hypothetical protein